MVAQCGLMLAELPESARESRDIAEIAARQDGLALEYASEELQDDSYLVLIAVEQNGMALEFASEVVQNKGGSNVCGFKGWIVLGTCW